MTIPAWPGSLPQAIRMDGYNEKAPDGVLRSPMDAGPGKQRRRTTSAARPISGTIAVSSAQLDTFITFFNTTLLAGSLRFSWREPRSSGTPAEFRFTQPPEYTPAEGNWIINMKLEIMP